MGRRKEMEFKTIIGKNVLLAQLRKNRERYVETRKTLIEARARTG